MKTDKKFEDEEDDYSGTMGPELDPEDEPDDWEEDDWEEDEESDDDDE